MRRPTMQAETASGAGVAAPAPSPRRHLRERELRRSRSLRLLRLVAPRTAVDPGPVGAASARGAATAARASAKGPGVSGPGTAMDRASRSRLEQDLDASVLLVAELLVCGRSIVDRHAVRRQEVDAERIALALEQRQDLRDPPPDVGLPHPDLDLRVEELAQREHRVGAAVDADDRERAAAPH